MERQQSWDGLMAEAQRLFREELDSLVRRLMWSVDPAALLRDFRPTVEGLLRGACPGGEGSAPAHNPYRALGLDPSAPDEVVRLVYRHLARGCHPDHGGSPEAMARLNRAYEEIARMRGWR